MRNYALSIPDGGVSGRELLAGFGSGDSVFSDEELDAIDARNANDLWIGATGLAHDLPVVTRNARDFEGIPNLKVLSY